MMDEKNFGGHTPERILRNTSIMIGALSLQKLIALFYFAAVARWFGPTITGEFFFASSIGMLLTVFFDWGQSALLIRSSAKDFVQSRANFRVLVAMKLFLGVFGAILMGIALAVIHINALLFAFIILIFFSSVAETLQVSCYGILRSKQLHGIEGIAGIIGQCVTVVIGFLVYRHWLPLPMLIGAFFVTNLLHFLFVATIIHRRFQFSLVPYFSLRDARAWLHEAMPFAVASWFVKVGTYTDSVFLRTFSGAAALGVYSIPFKATFSWQFIPQGLVATLFPAMSFFAGSDRERLGRAFHRAVELLCFIATPIAFGLSAIASALIPALFGTYYRSGIPLVEVYAFAIFPLFLQYPIGSLLNATDRAAVWTKLLGIAMVINVLVNAALVPVFGAWGAITAACVSHSVLVALGAWKAQAVIDIAWRKLGFIFGRILVAGCIMFAVVRELTGSHLVVQILAGAIVYMVATWLFGSWSKADLKRIIHSLYGRQDTPRDTGVLTA